MEHPDARRDDDLGFALGHSNVVLARFIDAMNGKNVLCQIDVNGYDGNGLPYPTSE